LQESRRADARLLSLGPAFFEIGREEATMSRRTKFSNTERAYDDLMDEFSNLVEAMEDVFSAATEDSGEKFAEVKGQAEASLKKAKARLGLLEKNAMAKARKLASDSDDYVHENPWTAIGVGAGVGLLLGLLIGRK
jgi:ElaB/YqjD/DUF883 family membrane-anchored ribosome-binding protein